MIDDRFYDPFGGGESPAPAAVPQTLATDLDAGGHRIVNRDRSNEELLPSQYDAAQYLAMLADRTISRSQFRFGGGVLAGKIAYAPGAAYAGNEYLRDLAMTVRNRLERFGADEILGHIALFDAAKANSGEIPDAVDGNGTAVLAGGHSLGQEPCAIDNQYEFVDLVYSHYRKTGRPSAYLTYANTIGGALAYPRIVNHLVYIDTNADTLQIRIGFGFQDAIASTGYELMTSVMRYRALRQLAVMANAAGQLSAAAAYLAEAAQIPAALETYLWDAGASLFLNASIDNAQHSIPGSAYAVVQGCCSSTVAEAIANKLIAGRPGNADAVAGKGFYQNGQVRHLPLNENWTRIRTAVANPALGTYQNGAYWATFTGWVAQAIATVDEAEADKLVQELVTYFRTEAPANVPIEASNSGNGYVGSTSYMVSAALPIETYAAKTPAGGPALNLGGMVNLIRGLIEFGGGGYLHSDYADTTERGGVMLNNGTNDSPAVKFATGDYHNIGIDSTAYGLRISTDLDEGTYQQLAVIDCTNPGTFAASLRQVLGLDIGAWAAPSLQNGWTNYGSGQRTAGYRKEGSRVWLRGLLKDGTATPQTVLFTLPTGFRPTQPENFPSQSGGAAAGVGVNNLGQVTINFGSNADLSLNGISFATD